MTDAPSPSLHSVADSVAQAAAQPATRAWRPSSTRAARQVEFPAPVFRRYFAVVDAPTAATITANRSARLLRKRHTVALARSLGQELESRGITTLVLRDSDANLRSTSAPPSPTPIRPRFISLCMRPRAVTACASIPRCSRMATMRKDRERRSRAIPLLDHRTTLSLPLSRPRPWDRRRIPETPDSGPRVRRSVASSEQRDRRPLPSKLLLRERTSGQLTAPDYQQLVTSAVATAIAATHDQLGAAQ